MSTKRVKFIPVKDGDHIDMGDSGIPGISGRHKILGFKPGPGPRAAGWIVVLVDGDAPKTSIPHRVSVTPAWSD